MNRKSAVSLVFIFVLMLGSQAFPDEGLESAQRLIDAGKYNEAIRCLKRVTQAQPSNVGAWLLLGDCYGSLGKNEKAIRAYERVMRVNPEHADAIFRVGASFTRLGQHSNAIKAYKEAIRIQPEHAQAHFYLGMSYDRTGRIGRAFEEYKILKTLDKGLADELYRIILGSS